MKRIKISLICAFTAISTIASAQNSSKPPINWQLMDWKQDGYPGISVEKAYNQLLKDKKPKKKIIVAIIDMNGFDNTHPDLAGIQWTNKKEIAGNGIDDDKNSFIDDIHGWNFAGNATHEVFECVREYVRLRSKYENNTDTASLGNDPGYVYWKKVIEDKKRLLDPDEQRYILAKSYSILIENLRVLQTYWRKELNNDLVYVHDIRARIIPKEADTITIKAHNFMKDMFVANKQLPDSLLLDSVSKGLQQFIENVKAENHSLMEEANTTIKNNDPAYYRKKELGDDPYINNGNLYGNNNTKPYPGATHSTFIAGIIAATRNNGIGLNGITNSVEIMTVIMDGSHVSRSDEWDKDVANSIKYAVDNGAQIINMSFGKYLSPQKEWVDAAIKYAEQKGVLLIAGAGNDKNDNDVSQFYPYAYGADKKEISNFIKVAASTYDSSLVVSIPNGWGSNYGKNTVDVFAPGEKIYSTVLDSLYDTQGGTSFATPMVTGLAALIWSYYPTLTYRQVKYCIEKSATPINTLVIKPGTKEKVPFSSLSRTGGIVNAYKAVKLADEMMKK